MQQQTLKAFDSENKLTTKQIQLFSAHYDYNTSYVVQLEGFTHFAVSRLDKEKVNDFCLFIHKDEDNENDKGKAFVAPCHHILEDGISILVFELGNTLPVKARPLQLLYNKMTKEHFEVLYNFFGYDD